MVPLPGPEIDKEMVPLPGPEIDKQVDEPSLTTLQIPSMFQSPAAKTSASETPGSSSDFDTNMPQLTPQKRLFSLVDLGPSPQQGPGPQQDVKMMLPLEGVPARPARVKNMKQLFATKLEAHALRHH